MSKNTSRLGRGLSALLDNHPEPETAALAALPDQATHDREQFRELPLDVIIPNPHQPRTDFAEEALQQLAASIKNVGVLQPILTRQRADGRFELIAGERRLRAAKLAGMTTIPAIVREASADQAAELALIENLQREDLAPLERARAYQEYLDTFRVSPEQLAQKLSESRANVVNYLRLLKLEEPVRALVESGELGMGQARALITIAKPEQQLAIARLAVRRNLSVRQVEELVRQAAVEAAQGLIEAESNETIRSGERHYVEVERSLSKAVGVPIQLRPGKRKNAGRLIIHYASLTDFERIVGMLGAKVTVE